MSDKVIKDLIDNDISATPDTNSPNDIDKLASKSTLSDEEVSRLLHDQDLEEKYGDSPLRTFVESAISSTTFGVTDQLLTKTGISSEEELRERRKRNKEAAIAGEITGVIAPALASGGSSILAKVLGKVGVGVTTAAKTGRIVENLTAKSLNKLLAETGKRSIAKEVLRKSISKGAGSAVEGSFYGAGKLISEEALGNADFNAENFIAHAGTGALLGGAVGSTIGTVEAVVPIIKGNNITGWATKKFKGTLDPELNAQQLIGKTPSQISKMSKMEGAPYKQTPKVIEEVLRKKGLSIFSSNEKLFKSLNSFIKETGENIGSNLTNLSKTLRNKGATPTRSKVAYRIVNRLEDLKAKFTGANGKILAGQQPNIARINRTIKQFDEDLVSDQLFGPKGINELKSKYQKLAKWERKGSVPLNEEINREISRALREELLEVADKAGGSIGENLRRELQNYGAAIDAAESLGKKIDTQSLKDFVGVKELFLGGMLGKPGIALAAANKFARSDLKRKLVIMLGIEEANIKISSKITKGVQNFLKGKKALQPATTKILIESKLAHKHEDGKLPKKPKNKKEAFKNMQENLNNLQDPENAYALMNIGNMEEAAPLTASHSQTVLMNSINFLSSKLPKDATTRGAFSLIKRDYEPSTIELAKFEKYIQAIENPLSIIDELQNGTITRESVEAIQAVYPNLYQRIQQQVMTEIANNPEAVTYNKRLNLGILLDLPTDTALQPQNLLALQSHYKEAEASQRGGAFSISSTKAKNIDIAESRATQTQKIRSGKVGD